MKRTLLQAGLALALALPLHAGKEDVYAIVGARIVTVSGASLESGNLVMRGGILEAVGATATIPPDARVFDGKGWTLTPGLFDGFGGVGLPAARAGGPAGSGAAPAGTAPAAPAASPLAPQALALDRVRAADVQKARDSGITTALVIPKEGVLPGRSVLLNLSGDKADGMVLRQPAALHLHMTSLRREYPGSLMGTVAYVRQALLDATHYRDEWGAYEKAPSGKPRPKYDPALAAWQDVLSGRLPLVFTCSRENDIRRAFAVADEFKVKVAIAGAPQASRLAPVLKLRKATLLVSVNFDPPRAAAFFGGGDEEKERKDIEEAEKNPAELHKAGVPFALVSGHAPNFLAGVQKAIEHGLPREAALRAVTLAPAEALGVADRTGSLDPGKIANVVAWSGEPLAKDAKVKLVFVDGKFYEPDDKADKPELKKDEGKKPDPAGDESLEVIW